VSGIDPKKLLYDQVGRDSQNMKHLGEDWNWGFLADEGKKNEKNPGRAIGKAAGAALTWYLGGPAWSGASAAGSAGAGAGASGAYTLGANAAANTGGQIASQAGAQGLSAALQGAKEGLLSGGRDFQQWLGNAMGRGYVDQLGNATEGAMVGAPTKSGLLGFGGGEGAQGDFARRYAMNQARTMMTPEEPPQAPARPFQYQQEPIRNPYGQEDPLANLTEEQKMQLRMMGYQV
jgi:hypothetical protein